MTELTRRRLLASAGVGAAGIGLGGAAATWSARRRARHSDGTGRSPSTASTRPGSTHRPRTASTSPPSTWSTDEPGGAARTDAGVVERGGRNDRRADDRRRQRRLSWRRPTTPARRSACCPRSLTVTFGFGPSLFERRELGLAGLASRRAGADPAAARRRAERARKRRRHLRAGLLRRSPGRLPRDPQPGPDRPRHRGHALVPARLRPHRHAPAAARTPRAT